MMRTVIIPLEDLREPSWNPNLMSAAMEDRLCEIVRRYGQVQNLVVRPLEGWTYEVLNGSKRLKALKEAGYSTATCILVDLDGTRRTATPWLAKVGSSASSCEH